MGSPRRPYESPVRRQQTEATRQRILDAGCAVLEQNPSWDWREVTFRAIATETGLSDRTVYRYFANEEELHAAILGQLAQKSGASLDGGSLQDVRTNVVRFLSWYARHATPAGPGGSAGGGGAEPARRRSLALMVESATPTWEDRDRRSVAGVLDLLTNVRVYEPLLRSWGMSPDQATTAVAWLVGLVTDAIEQNRPPSAG